ncbi:ubiquitin carboxyl-terminal hydrolase MINDY-2 isoform X2 [Tachyglossus aculeatus]|uniref:ubiquitin carboxyl-terminal hydrolase MINDY-2 isoform X2 n=1 Tax=Tachyglossus aculeatus TaxID=9261 RepID=UPI0018F61237|nr:ubiquitin carboxyl-terminal hydrolase MINDY-2 isoform X2 [Tachyglossus aculeatus]
MDNTTVGSTTVGSTTVVNTTMGSTSMGSTTMGSTAMDNTTMSSTALDNTTMSSTAMVTTAMGSTAVDNATVGSTALDNTTMTSTAMDNTTMSRTAMVSAAMGSTAVDNTTVGITALDNTAMSGTAMGSTAVDNTTMGSTAMDNIAMGSTAMVNTAMGSTAMANAAMGSTTMGSTAMANTAMGSTAMGSTALDNTTMGSTTMDSIAMGSTAMVNAAMGSCAMGITTTGSTAATVGSRPGEADGSGSSSSLAPSPASLDSLDSFSNLQSCPSSSELTSEDGAEEPGAVAGRAPGEDGGGPAASWAASKERFPGQSLYHIKWIQWKEESTPIITQNENGPCPLLAILNVLLLAWKVKLPPMMEIITAEQLMEYLGDYILDAKPKDISEIQRLNYEQNMSDAMAILHKLQTGLDVNVKFTGVRVFEYTPECIVFDLLAIPLYHGWLVDPQIADIVKAVGNCSYNQLVEKIIFCKQSDNRFVAEQFLNTTATQLTYHGLCELTSAVQEGELCVFFRNNHFSTMTKYKGQLYLLVTDQGFLTEEKIVWESLHNVDGDGNFCDSEFHLRPPSDPETVYRGQQDQIDQDYLMALSLQQEQQSQELNWEQIPEGISDLELAKKLQEEEDRRASQYYQEQEQEQAQAVAVAAAAAAAQMQGQPAPGAASPASSRAPGSGERKRKEPRERDKEKEKEKNSCVIL